MSGSILNSVGRLAYQLSFEISPIILTGGIAADIPGGMLPIVAITEAANFVTGLLSGGTDLSLDRFFAHYRPLPGSTLNDYQYGTYPFANIAVAANAGISQPLRLSMLMEAPVQNQGGHTAKLLTLMSLQKVLDQHVAAGGLFTIATPAGLYPDMLLLQVKDASHDGKPQSAFILDFFKPLVTSADAQMAYNAQMGKLSSGVPTDGSSSGGAVSVGTQSAGSTPSVVPSASNLAGTSAPGDLSAGTAVPGFTYQAPTVPAVTSTPL